MLLDNVGCIFDPNSLYCVVRFARHKLNRGADMSGDQIVQIVTIIMSALVSIVGLLLRARIIALEGNVEELRATISSVHALMLNKPTP